MERAVRTFRVQDKNGVRFTVFARKLEDTIPNLEHSRRLFRFELETGEAGYFTDVDTFILDKTGESFCRVRRKTKRESQVNGA